MQGTDNSFKDLPQTLQATNSLSSQRLSQSQDNLGIFVNNVLLYCKLTNHHQLDSQAAAKLVLLLRGQLNQLWFEERLSSFSDEFKLEPEEGVEVQPYEKKLYELEMIIRAVTEQKNNASSEEGYVNYETEANKYVQHLEAILGAEDVRAAINDYQIYEVSGQEVDLSEGSQVNIPSSHFFKERVTTKIDYGPAVFHFVRPQSHQYYLMEAARAYSPITPFKIKHISLSIADGPVISRPNYFQGDLDEGKSILGVCISGTNKLGFYSLADVCRVHTVGKEYYQERELTNDWTFSQYTKSVVTPAGKIYAINCRTTKDKLDPYLYEITDSKASNRGPLLAPKRDSALLPLNGYLYLLGGQGEGEKCSRKNYRYSLKGKKWEQLAESNVALRKPTVCAVSGRYICKLGGLNEFDYISKVIEMYDTVADRWSLVRASPRNILEEVQVLEDSHAVQINDDQVYVFGGRNANKFSTDTGFVLLISEIRERKKGAAKITGEFWNVSVGKRSILTFFGQFSASSVVVHHNCLYGLRTEPSRALAP